MILLTGIPGTGKTTLAENLKDQFGYTHIDLEIPWHDGTFPKDEEGFKHLIDEIRGEKIIITWGFPTWLPHYIRYIEGKGYKHIWLDGDRDAAFKNFMKRENNDAEKEKAYFVQVNAVNHDKTIEILKPSVYDPFLPDGSFKPIAERAEAIINL